MTLTKRQRNNIFAHFFPEDIEAIISPIKSGHINDTFRVDTKHGKYILQQINTSIFDQPEWITDNMVKVAQHLKKCSYPKRILSPISTKEGNYLQVDQAGNQWRVFPFFENTKVLQQPENANQSYAAARAYAEFSSYLFDFPTQQIKEIIPKFHDTLTRIAQFENALRRTSKEKLKQAEQEILGIKKELDFLKSYAQLDLPLRITHNDTKISNVLFDSKGVEVIAVIDWDTIMPGSILSDFGDIARTFCTNCGENEKDVEKVTFNKEYYKSVKAGFMDELGEKLRTVEKQNLNAAAKKVTLVQAMRFLTDFLNGNVYYKVDYPTQNLHRCKNQLVLYFQMKVYLA